MAVSTVAVVIPPLTNLNAPYAAGPLLAGWLRAWGCRVIGFDASLTLARRVYCRAGVERLFAAVDPAALPAEQREVYANRRRYAACIEPLIAFLQGRDPSLATRIVRQAWLPQGPRFAGIEADAEQAAFGRLGQSDQARWLGTLVLQDLADCWRASIAPHFGLTSYGDRLAESASSYEALQRHLLAAPDAIESLLLDCLPERLPADCALVALSCPFPGNLPGALRIAQWLRRQRPACRILLGGGYPSTELRQITDPRPFDLVDAIVYDDGVLALRDWLARLDGRELQPRQCAWRDADGVVRLPDAAADARGRGGRWYRELPGPDYDAFPLDGYLDLLDSWNPAHRLWNEGRWQKLTAAQGCYWKRCTFCDTSLPYIDDFQPQRAAALADRMDAVVAQTGVSAVHFTDEAAPPALLLRLAEELLARQRSYHWWGNIRFDDYFTADRCRVLAAAGLIAVTGGIEVAEARTLQRVDKGVDLPQLVRVCRAFASAGILVHGYLMYGFPGQSLQECIDSAEVVRQLMAAGILHSGFWHRFTLTAHSPIGADPAAYGCRVLGPAFAGFAHNNLQHQDDSGVDYDALGPGLAGSLSAWMRGETLDLALPAFFGQAVPAPRVAPDFVEELLTQPDLAGERPCWLGEAAERCEGGVELVDECGELQFLELDEARAATLVEFLNRHAPAQAGDRRGAALPADLLAHLHEHGLVWL